jgi:hypothetical protein
MAGFYHVHSIGAQVDVSDHSTVSVHNVDLAVKYARRLLHHGIVDASLLGGLNLPFMLYLLSSRGLPRTLFGKEIEKTLAERMTDRAKWVRFSALAADKNEPGHDPGVCHDYSAAATSDQRWQLNVVICSNCFRQTCLGYIVRDLKEFCFRCDAEKLQSQSFQLPTLRRQQPEQGGAYLLTGKPTLYPKLPLMALKGCVVDLLRSCLDDDHVHATVVKLRQVVSANQWSLATGDAKNKAQSIIDVQFPSSWFADQSPKSLTQDPENPPTMLVTIGKFVTGIHIEDMAGTQFNQCLQGQKCWDFWPPGPEPGTNDKPHIVLHQTQGDAMLIPGGWWHRVTTSSDGAVLLSDVAGTSIIGSIVYGQHENIGATEYPSIIWTPPGGEVLEDRTPDIHCWIICCPSTRQAGLRRC